MDGNARASPRPSVKAGTGSWSDRPAAGCRDRAVERPGRQAHGNRHQAGDRPGQRLAFSVTVQAAFGPQPERAPSSNRGFTVMSIGSAIERGSLICVYDEHGRTLFSKARGSGPSDGLLGFTGSTVIARYGSGQLTRPRPTGAL